MVKHQHSDGNLKIQKNDEKTNKTTAMPPGANDECLIEIWPKSKSKKIHIQNKLAKNARKVLDINVFTMIYFAYIIARTGVPAMWSADTQAERRYG